MPKVGVGILEAPQSAPSDYLFQSIYAQSGRWNSMGIDVNISNNNMFQSIYAQSGRWNITSPR